MAHGEPVLRTGETLTNGQYLTSSNGSYHATLQSDGNFVIYRGSTFSLPNALWGAFPNDWGNSTRSLVPGEYTLEMQTDGNLVVYKHENGGKAAFWDLATRHTAAFGPDRWAQLFDDGNFVVGPNQGAWDNRCFATDRTGEPGEHTHHGGPPAA
jgi:hypothetical protein